MLRLMRENAGSWIIKILLGIVVLVFIFLGIGPGDTKDQNTAVVVNKKVITMDEFRLAYNNTIERYRSQFGNNLNDEFIKMLGIKEKTLDSLIDREVILQEAERLGIQATDEEVFSSISDIKFFQENGHFNPDRYASYIKGTRQPAEYFEERQRQSLVFDKLQTFVEGTVNVTDDELRAWYLWEKASVNINYQVFSPSDYSEITLTEDEIKGYYDEHSANYKTQPTVSISYLKYTPADYLEKAEVTDAEIAEYYESRKDSYTTPKTVRARHILIKVDEKADADTVEKARLKAVDIHALAVKEGQDFAELAKQHSEGPSKDTGGDLGEFEKDRMVKPFADKAFSMKAGEISDPVKTRFGWHIIKVEKVNEATSRQLSEVTEEIRNAKKKEKSETLAYEESTVAYDTILGGDELKQAAVVTGVKLVDSEPFTEQAGVAGIDTKARLRITQTAFDMAKGEISDIIDVEGTYYIFQVTDTVPAMIQPIEDVHDKVKADCKTAKQDSLALKAADDLLIAMRSEGTTLAGSAEAKETGLFKRDASGKDLGIDREIVTSAFMLSSSSPLPEAPVKTANGYYVISFKEKKDPEMAGFDAEKEAIRNRLLADKKRKTFDSWLAQLKTKSTIEKNPQFFN